MVIFGAAVEAVLAGHSENARPSMDWTSSKEDARRSESQTCDGLKIAGETMCHSLRRWGRTTGHRGWHCLSSTDYCAGVTFDGIAPIESEHIHGHRAWLPNLRRRGAHWLLRRGAAWEQRRNPRAIPGGPEPLQGRRHSLVEGRRSLFVDGIVASQRRAGQHASGNEEVSGLAHSQTFGNHILCCNSLQTISDQEFARQHLQLVPENFAG
mmetsp:Transcript_23523/g.44357  ORF Transcript_23523/g.44357 Transcript_23523/m.44357 type:complete len:210 (-) Transcript_23523:337-966(-)